MLQSEGTYIEEFIPRMGPYLHCILNAEGVPAMTMCQSCANAPFEWRCSDCFPAPVLCEACCRTSHQRLPFHRVQKWTGEYFMPSWLREVGVCLHLGHSGGLCPNRSVCHQVFFYSFDPILRKHSRVLTTIVMKTVRGVEMRIYRTNMQTGQLQIRMGLNLALAAPNSSAVIKTKIPSLPLLIGPVSTKLASSGAAALKLPNTICS